MPLILRGCGCLRRCSCSHTISARAGAAAAAPQKPNAGTGYRPESLVRTDSQMQKLHSFFIPGGRAPTTSSSPAILTQQGGDHKKEIVAAEAHPASSSAVQQEVPAAEGSALGRLREYKRPRLAGNTDALAAVARERLQMEAHSGGHGWTCHSTLNQPGWLP